MEPEEEGARVIVDWLRVGRRAAVDAQRLEHRSAIDVVDGPADADAQRDEGGLRGIAVVARQRVVGELALQGVRRFDDAVAPVGEGAGAEQGGEAEVDHLRLLGVGGIAGEAVREGDGDAASADSAAAMMSRATPSRSMDWDCVLNLHFARIRRSRPERALHCLTREA